MLGCILWGISKLGQWPYCQHLQHLQQRRRRAKQKQRQHLHLDLLQDLDQQLDFHLDLQQFLEARAWPLEAEVVEQPEAEAKAEAADGDDMML